VRPTGPPVAHGIVVPHRTGQEVLEAVRVAVTEGFGQRPAVRLRHTHSIARVSRREKHLATRLALSPKPSRHTCCATVASTVAASCFVVTDDHDRGDRTHARGHPSR
jgi:hypothetical protein